MITLIVIVCKSLDIRLQTLYLTTLIYSFNLFSHVLTWWHLRSHPRLLILTMLTWGRTGRCHPGIRLHRLSCTPRDYTRHHHSTWSGPGKPSCVVVVGLLLAVVVVDLSTVASPDWSLTSDLVSDWSEMFSRASCAPARSSSRRCQSACPQWSWPPLCPRPWGRPWSGAASGTPGSPPTRWWASWPGGTCWSWEGSCWWGSSQPALSDDCLVIRAQLHSEPEEHFFSTSLWERREVCRKQFRCFGLLLSSAGSISLTWIFWEAWKLCCARLNQ